MRTHAERLLALGYEEIGAGFWKHPEGFRVELKREWIYRTHVMSHGPNAGAEVPQYGEPKIQVTSWILKDTENQTIIQQHSTLGALLRWMEAHKEKIA